MADDPIVDAVERFAKDQIDARAIDHDKRIPRAVIEGLAEMGLFGLTIPEQWGGIGLELPRVAKVIAAIAKVDRSVATTVGLHGGLGTRGLVAYGTDAQKERWLPDLASGKRLAAFATTESEAGSDLTAIRTRAVPEGDDYVLNGQKIYVTNGALADVFTLSVASSTPEARRGLQLMVFEKGDGIVVGAEEEKLGLRGSSTTSLFLDGVRVPSSRALGAPTKGSDQLSHVLCVGRTLMAAGCVGSATGAIDKAVRHTMNRRQFGKALASLEVVREQLATMEVLRAAMEALVDVTTRALDEEMKLHRLSLAAKIFCSESAWEITDLAVQLHGGSGFVEETGVAILQRDARITRIFEGANDVLRVRLGLMYAGMIPAVATGPLGEVVRDQAIALKAAYGVRLATQPRELWRLGGLVTLAETAAALAGSGAPADTIEHFNALAQERAAVLVGGPLALGPIDTICKRLLEAQ